MLNSCTRFIGVSSSQIFIISGKVATFATRPTAINDNGSLAFCKRGAQANPSCTAQDEKELIFSSEKMLEVLRTAWKYCLPSLQIICWGSAKLIIKLFNTYVALHLIVTRSILMSDPWYYSMHSHLCI